MSLTLEEQRLANSVGLSFDEASRCMSNAGKATAMDAPRTDAETMRRRMDDECIKTFVTLESGPRFQQQ